MELQNIRRAFEGRGFAVSLFGTAAEARDYLAAQCAGKTVSFGGSMTLRELGAYEALTAAGADVSWHWVTPGQYRQDSEIYITSANALSETGEIVNIDGVGNRVSAAIWGPKTCFTVCGVNKLARSLEAAVDRARQIAAPRNAQRLGCKTPCAADGKCHDCRSPARICRAMTVLMAPPISFARYELVLVDDKLGY
ncbi:MAG: lactate utilization protein [Intestinibacillus sp.]